MASSAKTVRLNTDTGLLKLIAIISMLIDHVGAAFFTGSDLMIGSWKLYTVMRIVGRLAFPIFAYCIAVGVNYTRSVPKYALRLLIIGIISQPLYCLGLNHMPQVAVEMGPGLLLSSVDWFLASMKYSNIMFELLLGLLVLWSIRDQKYALTAVLMALAYHLSPAFLNASYGWNGVVLMVLFYLFIDNPTASFAWVAGFMAWWGLSYTLPLNGAQFQWSASTQIWALLALPLIYINTKSGLKLNKWVFYLFYPAHLGVIYLIDYLIKT